MALLKQTVMSVFFAAALLCGEETVIDLPGAGTEDTGDVTISFSAQADTDPDKSEWGAAALSLALPGAGQVYAQNRRRAALYFALETVVFSGMILSRRTSDRLMDDAFSLAHRAAGVSAYPDQEDNYWRYITLFESSDDFNRAVEQGRDFDQKITRSDLQWQWRSTEEKERYTELRSDSEDWNDRWAVFAGAVVLNRVVSFIDARVLARRYNRENRQVTVSFQPVWSLPQGKTGLFCTLRW
ncbi:MAG: hypothetical protein ACQEQV_04810 [Fibrobacterota bacterium]